MSKVNILGINYENVTIEQAAQDVINLAKSGSTAIVVTPNAEIGETCFKSPELYEAVTAADYIIPDGSGVVLASRILNKPLKMRVAGFDMAQAMFPLILRDKLRLYMLGAKPGVAEIAADKIKERFPELNIVGIHDGYFQDDQTMIDEINSKSADILFVGLGYPKQELWMHKNRSKIKVGVMLGLGGSLDVFAGLTKRAPKLFIKLNLEWLFRLIKQPYRFIRMLKLPAYIIRAIGYRIFHKNKAGINYEC